MSLAPLCCSRWLWGEFLSGHKSPSSVTCSGHCVSSQKCGPASSPAQTINRARKKRPWYGLDQAGRAVIAHLEYKPINIQFFHTESDNDSHCFVLWASTYITHGDKSEFMSWVKMLQKFHPISLSVQSSHNPHSPPRLLDAVVTSERCGSPQFSSNIFLFDTLEGSFTRIQTWLPGKLDHNFVLDTTDTVLD